MDALSQWPTYAGSLIAILVVAAIARALRLGGDPLLNSDEAAARAANEVEDGFRAERIAIDRACKSALVADSDGRIIVIKRHGNRFAGRILTADASAREEVDAILVDAGEAGFGTVRLSLDESAIWADAINRLGYG